MGCGDERFTALVERRRRQVYCDRMLGPFEGAGDAVQRTAVPTGAASVLAEITTFGPAMFGPLGLPDRV